MLLNNESSLYSQEINFVKVKLGSGFDNISSTELSRTTKAWPDHAGHASTLHCLSNKSDPFTAGRDSCQGRKHFLNSFMLLKQNITSKVTFRVEMYFLFTQL